MTTAPTRAQLVALTPDDFAARLTDALGVYVAAMGYPAGTVRQRRPLWLDHSRRMGWRAHAWLDPGGELLGIAYGYVGGPGQWWFEEVRRGLRHSDPGGPATADWLADYFEVTELHIRPDAQGAGLGEGLLRALLDGAPATRTLLSTPEQPAEPAGRAWTLYRRLGFVDVLRDYRFTGDARPFAVLGRELPLPPGRDPRPGPAADGPVGGGS